MQALTLPTLMLPFLSRALYAILFLSFIAVGCDSSDDPVTPPPPPPPAVMPSFEITSASATDPTTGLDIIAFEALTNMTVELTEVIIDPPGSAPNQSFNGNNDVFTTSEAIILGPYPRLGGTWTFRFTGRLAGGAQTSFDVTQTFAVSGLVPDETSDV